MAGNSIGLSHHSAWLTVLEGIHCTSPLDVLPSPRARGDHALRGWGRHRGRRGRGMGSGGLVGGPSHLSNRESRFLRLPQELSSFARTRRPPTCTPASGSPLGPRNACMRSGFNLDWALLQGRLLPSFGPATVPDLSGPFCSAPPSLREGPTSPLTECRHSKEGLASSASPASCTAAL